MHVNLIAFMTMLLSCDDVTTSWVLEVWKNGECQRTYAFDLWHWGRLLRVPWTARISNQSIWKEINPEYSLEGLMLWCSNTPIQSSNILATWYQLLTHWKRPWCWERLKVGGEGTAEDEMVGWHHRLDGHGLDGLRELVMDREALHGVAKSRTQLSDWTDWLIEHLLHTSLGLGSGNWEMKETWPWLWRAGSW